MMASDIKLPSEVVMPPGMITPHGIEMSLRRKERAIHAKACIQSRHEMDEVISEIRLQLRHIIFSLRKWRYRHDILVHPVRVKYSSFQGDMCRADFKRHWAL